MSIVGGKKANRFFSRRLADLNEVRSKSTAARDLDPELAEAIGKEVAERHDISEEIKLQTKDAEDLRESLKGIYKSALPIATTLAPFAESVRAHNKSVQAFVEHLEPGQPTDSLRTAMSNTVRLQEHLVSGLEEISKGLDTLVVQPQQAFVKKDIRDARYFSHEFLKVQVDYEGSVSRLNQVKQKSKVDVKKYNQSFAEMVQFRAKFDQVAIDAQNKFAHMHEANAVDNAAHQLQYLAALRAFFARGMAICDEFSGNVQQVERDLEDRRGEREARDGTPSAPVGAFESQNSLASIPDSPAKVATPEGVYGDALALLTRADAHVVRGLATLAPEEEKAPLISSVSRILQGTNTFTVLLGSVLAAETAAADAASPPTASADGSPVWLVRPVFESDATVAALVADFFKSHGTYYAQNVLRPILRQLTKEPKAYELHPKKVSGDELQANATRLKKYVRDIADAIFESSVIAPLSVRQLSQSVLRLSSQIQATQTVKRDPKSDVAGLLFYHLFIPALVHPDEFGILTPDLLTAATKRNLYLLSLALRGVARRSKADEKSGEEWFLGPLDDAVLQSADNLVPYIASMCGEDSGSVPAEETPQSFEEKFPAALRQQDLDPLITRLDKNLLQLTPMFAQAGATDLIIKVGEVLQGFQALSLNRGGAAAMATPGRGSMATPSKGAPEAWNDDE